MFKLFTIFSKKKGKPTALIYQNDKNAFENYIKDHNLSGLQREIKNLFTHLHLSCDHEEDNLDDVYDKHLRAHKSLEFASRHMDSAKKQLDGIGMDAPEIRHLFSVMQDYITTLQESSLSICDNNTAHLRDPSPVFIYSTAEDSEDPHSYIPLPN